MEIKQNKFLIETDIKKIKKRLENNLKLLEKSKSNYNKNNLNLDDLNIQITKLTKDNEILKKKLTNFEKIINSMDRKIKLMDINYNKKIKQISNEINSINTSKK